jgi:hypothetical protein
MNRTVHLLRLASIAVLASPFIACHAEDGKPRIEIEKGKWGVTHCAPPSAEHRDFCHMLLCEAFLHNRGLIGKGAELVQMTQQFPRPDQSIQQATFREAGVQIVAQCEIKGSEITHVRIVGTSK